MPQRQLNIMVLRDRYPTQFNTPRSSRHVLKSTLFLPTNKISYRIEGLTQALPQTHDLAHYVNRIPIFSRKPYVMSFESHLPRYFGGESTALYKFMRHRLSSTDCHRIIAMSHFAKNIFLRAHANTPDIHLLQSKLEVVYPNIQLPAYRLHARAETIVLKLVFVGAHFGRKGGAVTARAAEIAHARGLPLHFHIISSLQTGKGIWTDPTQDGFFTPYYKALQLPNVRFDRGLPNIQTLAAMRDADFTVLTTFSDTFGYSAIESLGVGTPVIATRQGALPEFIRHGENGLLLDLPVDENGEWIGIARQDKGSAAFAHMFRTEIDRLAEQLIAEAIVYMKNPAALLSMRTAARQTAETQFDTAKISPYLDDLYERCVFQ